MKEISVFGEDARNIEEGQIFRAVKFDITQGDKVVLVPVVEYDKDGCPSYKVMYE